MPVLLNREGALKLSALLHLVTAFALATAGWTGNFAWFYWAGFLFFMLMLLRQHKLVSPNDLSKVNIAFMTTNGVASVVFGAAVILDLFLYR